MRTNALMKITTSAVELAVIVLVSVVRAVSALLASSSDRKVVELDRYQQEVLTKLLKEIDTGRLIRFIMGEVPIMLAEGETAGVVLPQTTFLEPRAVRVRRGSNRGSSFRIVQGFSLRSGAFGSTSESHDELRNIDLGTLVVTNQRLAFVGALTTVSVDIGTIVGVDAYSDGIGVHYKKRDKIQCFRISKDLTLKLTDNDREVSLPFTGQILHRIITIIMGQHGNREAAAAIA